MSPAPAPADSSGAVRACHAMALHLLKDGGSTAAATDGFESVQQLQKGIDVFREAVEG